MTVRGSATGRRAGSSSAQAVRGFSMAHAILVPRLGWTMEEGTFVQWLKRDGEPVKAGEQLFILEGEKAAQEVESIDSGILRIPPDAPRPGETVAVGALLGYLTAPGEPAPWEAAAASAGASRGQVAAAIPAQAATSQAEAALSDRPARSPRTKPAISPRARRIARELGIDWAQLDGSGRTGRIRERDVRAAARSGEGVAAPRKETTAPSRLQPLTPVRRLIAERMLASAHATAPVTLTTRADATNLVSLRNQFKAAAAPDTVVPSYTDFILKLTSLALQAHPALNACWTEAGIELWEAIHIGIAVDTDAGLLVPVVRDVQTLNVRQIAERSRELIAKAQARRLLPEQMQGGTFTITNLGMYGIDAFTPIINLPQCAILGLGRIQREPAVHEDRIVPRDLITLSLTFDHRAIDGGPAARFLDTLRRYIEQPGAWLVA
jgi:pyruvate dehydrogenase E2 component (dihydrolipoamide acetyltransferase)